MPWSDQGGGGQGPWGGGGSGGGRGNSPWGRPGGGPNPKDIEEMLRRSQQRFRGMFPGGFGGPKLVILGIAVLLGVWLFSGLYRVQPNQQGVPLVFGKFSGIPTEPGLHWNWPSPLGDVYLPNVTLENRIEIGFRSTGDGAARTLSSSRDVPEESQMITGDENLVDIDFVVFWRISDAAKYLFTLREPDQTVKVAAEAVMRDIIGGTRIQDALTDRRGPIESDAQIQLQRLVDEYGAGIEIRQVQLLEVDPPGQVIDAFNEVSRAKQDLERMKNEAEAYRNDVVPRARGEGAQIVEQADAYRQEVVNRAQGDSNRFDSVYQAYTQSKDITTQRIYLETLEEVLKNVNKVIIDDNAGGSGVVPYLPLPEIQKRLNRPGAGNGRPQQGGTQ
ncbi:FtsH protease activity modulator HflK [Thalassobaculum sp.]|uniref:FtsH protease activity modulator HflK n=1 Tax=Thalassobaculum sp. TaxID=2022740 RepID=UPI0032F05F06